MNLRVHDQVSGQIYIRSFLFSVANPNQHVGTSCIVPPLGLIQNLAHGLGFQEIQLGAEQIGCIKAINFIYAPPHR